MIHMVKGRQYSEYTVPEIGSIDCARTILTIFTILCTTITMQLLGMWSYCYSDMTSLTRIKKLTQNKLGKYSSAVKGHYNF